MIGGVIGGDHKLAAACCLLLQREESQETGKWKTKKAKKPKTISKFHVFDFYFLIKKIN